MWYVDNVIRVLLEPHSSRGMACFALMTLDINVHIHDSDSQFQDEMQAVNCLNSNSSCIDTRVLLMD